MKASLQEQLLYLQRIVNPNYIIIIGHKANNEMDFSQFKPVLEEQKIPKERNKTEQRYSITCTNKEEGKTIEGELIIKQVFVVVTDVFFKRDVFNCLCKIEKKEELIKELKKRYKGSSIEDKIL